jgi:hypothetical protein
MSIAWVSSVERRMISVWFRLSIASPPSLIFGVLGTKPRPSQLGPHARNEDKERCYVVMSPRDLVLVRKRDLRDRVQWLVERAKWEEALKEVEKLERMEAASGRHRTSDKDREGEENEDQLTVHSIGDKYMDYLVDEGTCTYFIRSEHALKGRCRRV